MRGLSCACNGSVVPGVLACVDIGRGNKAYSIFKLKIRKELLDFLLGKGLQNYKN